MVAPRFRKADSIQVPKAAAGGVLGTLGFSWMLVLYLFFNQPSSNNNTTNNTLRGLSSQEKQASQQQQQQKLAIGLPNGAPPVYGILEEIDAPSYRLQDPNQPRKTEIVYAVPPSGNIKGIVLLLHPCEHHGRKFFTKSDSCPTCVPLSEEMRTTRIVLEQKSLAVLAVTAHNRKNGCWDNNDQEHIQDAIYYFKEKYPTTGPVMAIGASSGGEFGAQLAVRNIVDAAMVGVMHLGPELVQKWMDLEKKPPLYLAVMPRHKERVEKAESEFQTMNGHGPVLVDKETCQSRPVDASYLNSRVPNLTMLQAQAIVNDLIDAGHIDPITEHLIIDPTGQSNWRDILKTNCGANSGCLENQSLEPGESPLAKSLNRAWAFHELCSEVTLKALQFFEKELGGEPFLQQM